MKRIIVDVKKSFPGSFKLWKDLQKSDKDFTYKTFLPYRLIRIMKKGKTRPFYFVGLFADQNKKKVLIKSVSSKTNNVRVRLFSNEIIVLTMLNNKKATNRDVCIPKLISSKRNGNSLTMVREFSKGHDIQKLSKKRKFFILKKVLSFLQKIDNTPCSFNSLKKRTAMQIFLLQPMYTFLSMKKDKKNFSLYMKLLLEFYKNFMYKQLFRNTYVFSHRDLIPQNILLYKNRIQLIDYEISLLAEKQTDLSLVALFYEKTLGTQETVRLISHFAKSKESVCSFIRITLYYLVQSIAHLDVTDPLYHERKRYAKVFLSEIIPQIRRPS